METKSFTRAARSLGFLQRVLKSTVCLSFSNEADFRIHVNADLTAVTAVLFKKVLQEIFEKVVRKKMVRNFEKSGEKYLRKRGEKFSKKW